MVAELSSAENQELLQAQQTINSFLQDSEMFMIVSWNYSEFVDLVATYLKAYIEKATTVFVDRPIYMNLNRSFINLLSSMRSYLDFMDKLLVNRYGTDSGFRARFRQRCRREYDDNLSYRFLYKLRNYSQHKGFPIGAISWGVAPSRDDPRKPDYFLHISAKRDSILRDFDWGPLTREIRALPEAIDILAHAGSMMESLSSIHPQTIKSIFATLGEAAHVVLEFGGRIARNEGQPVVFETEGDFRDQKKIAHRTLDIDMAARIASGRLEDVIRYS